MTLPFAAVESSTGYPFSSQGQVYSYSSDEGSCVDPGILSEASEAAAMASAFRARNDLYSCGRMHHKASRCYFRAAMGLQSDPVTRAGIMLLCHSHAMMAKVDVPLHISFAKEFQGVHYSAKEILMKEKEMEIMQRTSAEKDAATTPQQNEATENVLVDYSNLAPSKAKLSSSTSLTVSPAERLGHRNVISAAEDLLELERYLDLLGMKPITTSCSNESVNVLDGAGSAAATAPSHKPQNILIGKPGGGSHHQHHPPHIVSTPESPPSMCETPQMLTLGGGGDMMSTKENFFSHTTRRVVLPEGWKRESNSTSMGFEKNSNGGGELMAVADQVQGGGDGVRYTTATHLNDALAEVTRLQACIQRLSNENVSLLKERECIKVIHEYARASQSEMANFRVQYRTKYAELRGALEDFRKQNSSRQPLQGGEDTTSLTRRIASLETQLQREQALSREKDATIKRFSDFYKKLKESATRKQTAAAGPHNVAACDSSSTGKNREGRTSGQEEGGGNMPRERDRRK